MPLEQHRQAMLQRQLSDQQIYSLLRYASYQRFDGTLFLTYSYVTTQKMIMTMPQFVHSNCRRKGRYLPLISVITSNHWPLGCVAGLLHYSDTIMSPKTSQITSVSSVNSIIFSDAEQRKYQSSASLAFLRGIHQWLVNSLHKGPVTQKMFPFDDIMNISFLGKS